MLSLGELYVCTILIGSGSIALLYFSIELWRDAKYKYDPILQFIDRFIAASVIDISIFFIGVLSFAWLTYLGVV